MLVQCLSVGLASYIGAAHAADNAVLFKIHDINPIKNSDGIVTSCDLGATFFNRTGSEVTNATLNLVWPDDVVSDTIEQEQRAEKRLFVSAAAMFPVILLRIIMIKAFP